MNYGYEYEKLGIIGVKSSNLILMIIKNIYIYIMYAIEFIKRIM